MTEKTLSEILRDGTLTDNTEHTIRAGEFSSNRGGNRLKIKSSKGKNKPQYLWSLMLKAGALPTHTSKLVFRVPDPDYEQNTEDAFINLRGADVDDFKLTTGNLIGCLAADGQTLAVSSRFGDEFLKYIIADADGFLELPDQGGTEKGGYEWLLIYLWLVKLKKAFRLGLPKTYETQSENLRQVRGRLDPVDYSLNHSRAVYRCIYREHRYDNDATRLIARTLEHLESRSFLRDRQALNQTFQIAIHGQRSRLHDLLEIPLLRNPYYVDYNPGWEERGLGTDAILSGTIIQGGRPVPFHVAFVKVPEQEGECGDFWTSFGEQVKQFVSAFQKRLNL